ncbi:MAG: putative glycosylase, partial [Pseudomonadota bacterium]
MTTKSKVASAQVTHAFPDYWQEACKHLMKKDRVMKRLIPQFGDACLSSRGDAFSTLARSIVGQQISVKAAQ